MSVICGFYPAARFWNMFSQTTSNQRAFIVQGQMRALALNLNQPTEPHILHQTSQNDLF